MTRRAVSQGTLRYDPYCKLHPALPARRSRHMKLEDLKTLMEKPTGRPNLDRVRDWFLFSTFTGLAYADLKRLSEKDITRSDDGTYWLHIRRQKRIRSRWSACSIFPCVLSRNIVTSVKATKFSTSIAGNISLNSPKNSECFMESAI